MSVSGMAVVRQRAPEKAVQSQIRQALLTVGAKVYTIGRPPRKDAVFKGTGQTPGIPDLLAFLPLSPRRVHRCRYGTTDCTCGLPHQVWIEVKALGGTLRPAQKEFQAFCLSARQVHLVGGLDVVLGYLKAEGYVTDVAHYRVGTGV